MEGYILQKTLVIHFVFKGMGVFSHPRKRAFERADSGIETLTNNLQTPLKS